MTASCMRASGRQQRWINVAYYRCVYCADAASDGSAQDPQTKLKRARLADDLNEKISLRPGPLELVEKNIISVDSTVKEAALKGIGEELGRFCGLLYTATALDFRFHHLMQVFCLKVRQHSPSGHAS